jgi:DNA polymerase-4
MDAFFASVEQLDDPGLRGRCVLVGGRSGRGVVAAASYEARKHGVSSAMPMFQALRRCPQAVVVSPRRRRYAEVSRRVMEAMAAFSPLVEPVSIDEAYLDVTGCGRLHGPADTVARAVKRAVFDAVGLTCSVGAAPVRFLAKIASDVEKPDGLTVVWPEQVEGFIATLPIGKVPGVGRKTKEKLAAMGVSFLGDLRQWSEPALTLRLGRYGRRLKELSRGIDGTPVSVHSPAKSVSSEETFARDTGDRLFLRCRLLAHAEDVARQLRRNDLRARVVVLKVKDGDFTLHTRNTTCPRPVQTAGALYREAAALLDRYPLVKPLRLIGLGAAGLVPAGAPVQGELFAEAESRCSKEWEEVERAMDRITDRFGRHAIERASQASRKKPGRPKAARLSKGGRQWS